MFRAPCTHRQEVKIVVYSLWYHTETSEWSKIIKITKITKIYKYEHIVKFILFIVFIYFSYFNNFRPLTCFRVMIPEAEYYNFDLLTMSTWCSKHVEA